jgi:TP901 family phage tail tape measure protein
MPEETIGRASIKLGADGSKLGPEMAAAVAKAQGTLERSNKKIERAQAQTTRAIQGQINKINAKRPAQEMRNLEQAVRKMGGASKLEAGQVKRLRMEVERLAKAGANVPKSLAGIGKTRGGVGEGLSAASAVGQGLLPISAGVGALGFGVVKLASDFESSFAGVRKTVDATEAEFAALSDGFRQMSEEIPVSVNELNSIGEAAGQLGIETKNILGFTRVMADLGATTNLSAQEAATALARLANITGLPQDQFDELGSTIVDLGNKFETTESEIVDFGLRIAGAGRLAGLSEAEILAIGTAMSSIGVKAEAGGTAVQKVLNQMTAAVATNNEELAIFAETAGLSAQAFADAFKADAAGAFAAFVEGLGKQGTQAFSTMEDLKLESERVIRAFLGLAGAGDLLSNALGTGNAAWKENTALTKEAAERYATFGSQLTIFWNQVKNVGTTLGTALLPILISVMDVMKKGLPVVKGAAKSFASLPKPVQAAALALGALVTAAGPVLIALGFMAPGVAALIPLFGAATPVVAGLAAAFLPLTAVIAGLVGGANLGLWLRENSELFRQFTDFVGDAITKLTGLDLYFKTLEKGRDVTAEWTEEQKASLAELKKRQKALAEFVGPLQKVTKETKQQTEETKRQTQSVKKLTAEQKRAAAEFQRLLDSLSGAAAQAEIEKLAKAVNVLGVEGVADIEALRKKLEQLQKQGAEITDEGLLGILRGGKIEIPELDVSGLNLGEVSDGIQDISDSLVATGIEAGEQFRAIAEAGEKAGLSAEDIALALEGVGASGDQVRLAMDGIAEETVDWQDSLQNISSIVQGLPGPLQGVGRIISSIATGISGIGATLSQFGKGLSGGLSGLFGSFSKGFEGILAGISGIGGIATSVIGIVSSLGGKLVDAFRDPEEEVNDLRDAFFEAHGGFVEVQKSLVGLTDQDLVKKIFDAKTVDQFNAAVSEVMGLLDTQAAAQEALADATERYGFTIEELGPAMQRQELDKMAGQLLQDFELLKASGIDVGTILKRMGTNLSDFVNQSVAAGQAVPEAMRPMIEAAIANGEILDANGEAYASAEEAGITFAQTMSEQFSSLIEKIDQMVNALLGINNIDVSPNVSIPNVNIPGIPSGLPTTAELPRLAKGALVRKPTTALIGEAGPELVLPLRGPEALLNATQASSLLAAGTGLGGGGGGGDSITVTNIISEDPYQSAEGRQQLRRFTLRTVEREMSKHLAALVQAGKA